MLKVAKARYDGCLWTAQDDEVMLGLSGLSQLGTVWGFLEIFVGQGASHRTDVNDHVIARLDPLNLSLAESSPRGGRSVVAKAEPSGMMMQS